MVLISHAQFGIGSFCSSRNLLHATKMDNNEMPASRLRQLQYTNGPARMTGANTGGRKNGTR